MVVQALSTLFAVLACTHYAWTLTCEYQGTSYRQGEKIFNKDPCLFGVCDEKFESDGSSFTPYVCNRDEKKEARMDEMKCKEIVEVNKCCNKRWNCSFALTGKCLYNDRFYDDGEKLSVIGNGCESCFCDKNFNIYPMNCKKMECPGEKQMTDKGCVPFTDGDACCPTRWTCPDSKGFTLDITEKQPLNECFLPQDTGYGDLNGTYAYSFDQKLGRCVNFRYKGNGGNKNRFEYQYECEEACRPNPDDCKAENLPEKCMSSTMIGFAFDQRDNKCKPIACSSSENFFYDMEQCEDKCVHPKVCNFNGTVVRQDTSLAVHSSESYTNSCVEARCDINLKLALRPKHCPSPMEMGPNCKVTIIPGQCCPKYKCEWYYPLNFAYGSGSGSGNGVVMDEWPQDVIISK